MLGAVNINYVLHDDLKNIPTSGWIPPGNYRKALQQLCFAAGANVSTARRQNLYIAPLKLAETTIPTRAFFEISDAEKLMDQSVKLLPLVASIELISHTYTQGETPETVFQEVLPAGSHKIVFEKPLYDIVVDGPGFIPFALATEGGDFLTTENGDYIEVGGEYNFGPNVLYLTITEEGLVTITGYPWIDNQKSFFYFNPQTSESSNKITLKIESATLVNLNNAQDALNLLGSYYCQRYSKSITLLPSNLKTGDTILTHTIHNNYLLANLEKMASNLTGGFLANSEAIGIHVKAIYTRAARTGIAMSGVGLTRNNRFRERTFVVRSA